MVKLVPECIRCGSPVTDSLESEVEEQGQLKRGKYVNSVWICNDCEKVEKSKGENNQRVNEIGEASPADVSPNTPKADEADV